MSEFDNEGTRSLWKWQYHEGGHFNAALWDAITKADGGNLARLEKGFPEHVAAYRSYISEPGWWERVKETLGTPWDPTEWKEVD
jgi:hypothetical protein